MARTFNDGVESVDHDVNTDQDSLDLMGLHYLHKGSLKVTTCSKFDMAFKQEGAQRLSYLIPVSRSCNSSSSRCTPEHEVWEPKCNSRGALL